MGSSRDRLLVLSLTLAVFLSSVTGADFGPLLPEIARDLGAGITTLGQVQAAAALVVAGLRLVIGPLADGLGYRRGLRPRGTRMNRPRLTWWDRSAQP
jgi:predicted MFS family arabinose efflux permease